MSFLPLPMDTTTDFNYMVMSSYTNRQHHVLKESLPEKKYYHCYSYYDYFIMITLIITFTAIKWQ